MYIIKTVQYIIYTCMHIMVPFPDPMLGSWDETHHTLFLMSAMAGATTDVPYLTRSKKLVLQWKIISAWCQPQTLVLLAIPFAERGRVWSRCNYRVFAEERNYRPLR